MVLKTNNTNCINLYKDAIGYLVDFCIVRTSQEKPKTSVSGDITMIWPEVEKAIISRKCKMNLVSATSCKEYNRKLSLALVLTSIEYYCTTVNSLHMPNW